MRRCGVSAAVLLCMGVAIGWGQQPAKEQPKPPALTEARKKRLAERDRLFAEAGKLAATGKAAAAISTLEKVIALERELFGNIHEDVAGTAEWLAELHEQGEDFPAARK